MVKAICLEKMFSGWNGCCYLFEKIFIHLNGGGCSLGKKVRLFEQLLQSIHKKIIKIYQPFERESESGQTQLFMMLEICTAFKTNNLSPFVTKLLSPNLSLLVYISKVSLCIC